MSRIDFGVLFKEAREKQGLTQVETARLLNMARQTYLDIETGKTTPRAQTVYNFAELTGREVTYFFNLDTRDAEYISIPKRKIILVRELLARIDHIL